MSIGVYVAYAIDQAQPNRSQADLQSILLWLQSQPEVGWVFDPGAAFTVNAHAKRCPAVRSINAKALAEADAVVAVLPAGVVSVGVPMEIERALGMSKYVLVVSDAPSWMLELDNPRAVVYPEWGRDAAGWLSRALVAVSGRTERTGRALMPVTLDEGAEKPRRGYDDDAGLDLVVSETVVVPPGQFVDIPCGVSVELPDWSWGMITGRSSTLRKRGLLVAQGVIDAGYRGELFSGVWNLTDEEVKVEKGERLAQLIIHRREDVEVIQVEKLSPSERSENGFGSTGM